MSAAVFYERDECDINATDGVTVISTCCQRGESLQLVYNPATPTNLSAFCSRAVVSALVSVGLHSENTLFRAQEAQSEGQTGTTHTHTAVYMLLKRNC